MSKRGNKKFLKNRLPELRMKIMDILNKEL